jgi:uncharacterized membrane protein YdjX (TVP38/TMEM64 family)
MRQAARTGYTTRMSTRGIRLSKAALLAAILAAIAAFALLSLRQGLTPDALRVALGQAQSARDAAPLLVSIAFLGFHITSAAMSLPLNVPIAVAAGALFGLGWGVMIASFGAAIGSTLAMLSSRFLFRDWVQARYGVRLAEIEQGLQRNAGAYLASLRLMPAVPYTLVNLLFGLTAFPVWRFFWDSQLAMLPGKIVFVQAGTALDQVHSFSDILSPSLLAALVFLAVLPPALRHASRFWRTGG